MPPFDLIRRSLARHRPRVTPFENGGRRAAVALVLAGTSDALELCFIRRAEAPSDPWSGHMALPGGRSEPEDDDAVATAMRETLEEVGLALDRDQLLGVLSELPVHRGGHDTGMVLSGSVFYRGDTPPPLVPNEEVAEAFWIRLEHLWDPRQATRYSWRRDGSVATYAGIRFRQHVIWGLTHRVLTLFSDVLCRPLPHFEPSD